MNIQRAAKRASDRRIRTSSVDCVVVVPENFTPPADLANHDSEMEEDSDVDTKPSLGAPATKHPNAPLIPMTLHSNVQEVSGVSEATKDSSDVEEEVPEKNDSLEILERRKSRELIRRISQRVAFQSSSRISRNDTSETLSTVGSIDSRVRSEDSPRRSRRMTSKNLILKRGRVKKRKRTRQWKEVDLILRSDSLMYSYTKNYFSLKRIVQKKRLSIDDIESVSAVKAHDRFGFGSSNDGKAFEVIAASTSENKHAPSWRFRTESPSVAASWVKEISNAMRDRSQKRDRFVSDRSHSGSLTHIYSPQVDMFRSLVDSISLYNKGTLEAGFTIGRLIEKMSDYKKRWNDRFILYQPNARVLRYRRPYDGEDVWREEHWHIGSWDGCKVVQVSGEPLALCLQGATTQDGALASDLTLRFKTQRHFELVMHILREAGVKIGLNFLKYLRFRPSDLEDSLRNMTRVEKEWYEGRQKPEYATWDDDDAFIVTKYLDYMKVPPIYRRRQHDDRAGIDDGSSSRRSLRISMRDPRRTSLNLAGRLFHSPRLRPASSFESDDAFQDMRRQQLRARPTSRFFDSIRLASMFRKNEATGNVTRAGGHLEPIVEDEPKFEGNAITNGADEVPIEEFLSSSPATPFHDILLAEIGPPPTPDIDVDNTKASDEDLSALNPVSVKLHVDLGHVSLRRITRLSPSADDDEDRSEITMTSKRDSDDHDDVRRRRHCLAIEDSQLVATNMSSSDEAMVFSRQKCYVIEIAKSHVEIADVWEAELTIMSENFRSSESSKLSDDKVSTIVAGMNIRCRHGVEHLYRVIVELDAKGAVLSARCNTFLSEFRRLKNDAEYMKSAKRALAEHIERLPWGLVKNIFSKTEIAHKKRMIKQEFGSREYIERFIGRAQMCCDSQTPTHLTSKLLSEKNASDIATAETNGASAPRAIRSMVDIWTSEIAKMNPAKQKRLKSNVVRSFSTPDLMNPSPAKLSPGSIERSLLKTRIGSPSLEIRKSSDMPYWDASDSLRLRRKIAIFVLGPSASGKTHMTRANLRLVLDSNGLNRDSLFISIDGGIMRDCSKNWGAMKRMHTREYKGFKDLFGGYFQPHVRHLKKLCFSALLRRGVNMIIPETSVNASSTVEHYHGPSTKGKVKIMFDKLKREGYQIIMTAVHASREKCMSNGKHREVLEGKKYSISSWGVAIGSISRMFNYCRDEGYLSQTFFVMDNTDWSKPETLVVHPYNGIRLLATVDEDEGNEDDDELKKGSNRGRWEVFVLPRSGTLRILSTSTIDSSSGSSQNLVGDGSSQHSSKNAVSRYFFWKDESFEIKDRWFRSRETGMQWDLSGAAIATYTNGIKTRVRSFARGHKRNVSSIGSAVSPFDETKTSSGEVRSAALMTQNFVIEVNFAENSRTHHRNETLVVSPGTQRAFEQWLGTIVAAARWGNAERGAREGKLSVSL
eukprot:g2094.t1